MSKNKFQNTRYKTLDKCFRNSHRKYFMEDLIEVCNRDLEYFHGELKGIQRRKVFNDV